MHKGILNLFRSKIRLNDTISGSYFRRRPGRPPKFSDLPLSRNDQNRRKRYPDAAAGNLPLQLDYDSAVRLDAFASRRHLRI